MGLFSFLFGGKKTKPKAAEAAKPAAPAKAAVVVVNAAEAAATAESVLASGPVSSVNGRTGAVVLGMSDIAGLVLLAVVFVMSSWYIQ